MLKARRLHVALDVASAVLPIGLLVVILKTGVNVPFWDEWEWADLIYRMHLGTLQFSDLWVQHNEHRLLFPQLLVLGLDRIAPWSPIREQCVSIVFLVIEQIVLYRLVRRTARAGWISSIAIVVITFFLYGVWQWENFTWGFQTAWFICDCSAVAVAALLSRPNRGALQVALAMAIAVVASFSSAQGLVVWAVGGAAILLVPRRVIATFLPWTIVAAVTYAVYEHGLAPSGIEHFSLIKHPLEAAQYVLAYLGSPLGGWSGMLSSEIAGLVALSALAVAFVSDILRPRAAAFARRAPWYALAVFPIACAVATASGRAGLGLSQALASRYTSLSGLLWIALVAIAATRLSRRSQWQPNWPKYVAAASASIVFVLALQSNKVGWVNWKVTDAAWSSARAGLIVNDPAALKKLYPVDARIQMLIEELRSVHDGPFRNG